MIRDQIKFTEKYMNRKLKDRFIDTKSNFNPLLCGIRISLPRAGGGAPEAPPCISGTIHQKVTKLLEQTYVGKCRGFKA